MKEIILASGSPRRRELMELGGLTFRVVPAVGEEKTKAVLPGDIVEHLARHKAEEVFSLYPDKLIIGADTIVWAGGRVLGKPSNKDEARNMISLLQGKTHEVYTGVALSWTDEAGEHHCETFHEKTEVICYPMTAAEEEAYINTDEPYDKAGGYAIQGGFARYVQAIRGDYYTVMGLPLARLYQELKTRRLLSEEKSEAVESI